MIRVAVTEDEKEYRDKLKEYLERYGKEKGCTNYVEYSDCRG